MKENCVHKLIKHKWSGVETGDSDIRHPFNEVNLLFHVIGSDDLSIVL